MNSLVISPTHQGLVTSATAEGWHRLHAKSPERTPLKRRSITESECLRSCVPVYRFFFCWTGGRCDKQKRFTPSHELALIPDERYQPLIPARQLGPVSPVVLLDYFAPILNNGNIIREDDEQRPHRCTSPHFQPVRHSYAHVYSLPMISRSKMQLPCHL